MTADQDHAGLPRPIDPADLPTRRGRRLAARAAGRVDARGPRTGEFALTDAALAARDAAGLTADLTTTGRWRWLQREAQAGRPAVPAPRSADTAAAPAGRHRTD